MILIKALNEDKENKEAKNLRDIIIKYNELRDYMRKII